jgi:hypothetical protein
VCIFPDLLPGGFRVGILFLLGRVNVFVMCYFHVFRYHNLSLFPLSLASGLKRRVLKNGPSLGGLLVRRPYENGDE